jgi:TatD DNase family protein
MNLKNLVDFHCHLDLYPDFENIIKECEQINLYTLAVTTTPRAWPRNRDLTSNTNYVRAALGLHPQLIDKDAAAELSLWEKYLPEARYIGEIGLDFSPNFLHTIKEQVRVFERILQWCAKAGDKILSIHAVRSTGMVLDLIENNLPSGRCGVVMHWFTGSTAEAKRALELGCYFSINSKMVMTTEN